MPQGLIIFDADEHIVVVNKALLDMYALPEEKIKPGCRFIDYLQHRYDRGFLQCEPHLYRKDILSRTSENSASAATGTTADGRTVAMTWKGIPGGGWIVTHEDITARTLLEDRLSFLAKHDELTGLPNRAYLLDKIQSVLPSRRVDDNGIAIFMIDLDRFKEINDSLGHAIGDLLLKEVANRLRTSLRETDFLARLGGDEFSILVPAKGAEREAAHIAQKIVATLTEPFELSGHECRIGASVGISLAPKDGIDAEELLKNADLALYRSKADGGGTYHFFERYLDQQMQTRRKMKSALRTAVDSNEFELHYQPLLNLEENRIRSFEALIRWNRPGYGLVPPLDFIPLAEDTGLIVDIGAWVLNTACLEVKNWPEDIGVAVNVSAAQLKNDRFVEVVKNALEDSNLDAGRLELEVTESVVLADHACAHDVLTQLHALGVKLALDDFGTGYSSLATLRSFPFSKIKIDRSFVQELEGHNMEAEPFVRTIVDLGSNLGMRTTAEGVENIAQLAQVRAMGCTEIQGFYLAAPRPASCISELIEAVNQEQKQATA